MRKYCSNCFYEGNNRYSKQCRDCLYLKTLKTDNWKPKNFSVKEMNYDELLDYIETKTHHNREWIITLGIAKRKRLNNLINNTASLRLVAYDNNLK